LLFTSNNTPKNNAKKGKEQCKEGQDGFPPKPNHGGYSTVHDAIKQTSPIFIWAFEKKFPVRRGL